MKFAICDLRFAIWVGCVAAGTSCGWSQEQPGAPRADKSDEPAQGQPIDLQAALRLAGAQNLDVQIARERLAEAKANHAAARLQFFPWLVPGVGYRRHQDRLQDVVGNVFDADKQAYTAGASLAAQWDLGEAIYRSLAAKQLANAASHALDAQRQESTIAAANGYYDLLLAQAGVGVAEEAVRISENYLSQVRRAVEAGIAFKGDELRVLVQMERNQLTRRQAVEQQRLAAARLAQTLHLDPAIQLNGADSELVPLSVIATNTALAPLVQQALVHRPETKQSQSLIASAQNARNGVVYGPMVPSLGAQAFIGGFGGGRGSATGNFGPSEDYGLTLGWRLGPGGLFDTSRKNLAEARLEIARLGEAKLHDEITRQVVESYTRFVSLADQIATAERALKAAETSLRLAEERKQFGVGIVLETIQAEQDLTRARLDYFRAVTEFDKSQYALSKAVGKL